LGATSDKKDFFVLRENALALFFYELVFFLQARKKEKGTYRTSFTLWKSVLSFNKKQISCTPVSWVCFHPQDLWDYEEKWKVTNPNLSVFFTLSLS
jgi:hypothetical protein